LLAFAQVDAQETPSRRAKTTHCWDAIDRLKRPDIADRKIPGNCPRVSLDYRTPTEAFNELITTIH